jgi:hypothetical protein
MQTYGECGSITWSVYCKLLSKLVLEKSGILPRKQIASGPGYLTGRYVSKIVR